MAKAQEQKIEDEVLREFPPVGRYRVRLVANRKRNGEPVLDIREYVKGAEFEGFTRRGIRLSSRADLDLLRDVLKEVLEQAGLAKAGPGLAPVR
jgi:hypothetical protein